MKLYSELWNALHSSGTGKEHINNLIISLYRTCDNCFDPLHDNNTTSTILWYFHLRQGFRTKMDAFQDQNARKTGISTEIHLIPLPQHQYFNVSRFRYKLQIISKCRNLAVQNRWKMFLTDLFQETELNQILNDGKKCLILCAWEIVHWFLLMKWALCMSQTIFWFSISVSNFGQTELHF